jgi:hypothetical protein
VWIDYAIYLTTGVVLVSLVSLVVFLARGRLARSTWVVLSMLLVIGLIGTVLVRPERFRVTGELLTVIDSDGSLRTEVDQVGTCLSVFRRFGPLSFIMGTALIPDQHWDRAPYSVCETSGFSGTIDLPDSVRTGEWILCDYATCHPLIRA